MPGAVGEKLPEARSRDYTPGSLIHRAGGYLRAGSRASSGVGIPHDGADAL